MAGKSGRSINNVPKSPVKQMIFSWEGILVLLFIAVNIFCANFSEFYNLKSLLRQMPVYLAEIFLMLPMAHSGTWRDRYFRWIYRVSLCNNGLYCGKHRSPVYRGNPCYTSGRIPLRCCKRICSYQI